MAETSYPLAGDLFFGSGAFWSISIENRVGLQSSGSDRIAQRMAHSYLLSGEV